MRSSIEKEREIRLGIVFRLSNNFLFLFYSKIIHGVQVYEENKKQRKTEFINLESSVPLMKIFFPFG